LEQKSRRSELRFLSAEELTRLGDVTPAEYRPAIYLAGVLGLRWSEVPGLRVGCVDFLRHTLAVVETCAEVAGKVTFADVKSPSSRRTVDVPLFVLTMLAEHLAHHGRPGPEELLFLAPEGGPLRRSTFRTRVFNPAVRRAGLDGLTFHALRHTAVGLMIEAGAHPEAIKGRLGHASIRTTSDVYGHVLPGVDAGISAAPRGTIWCTDGARATSLTLTEPRMGSETKLGQAAGWRLTLFPSRSSSRTR
jgi:integrase